MGLVREALVQMQTGLDANALALVFDGRGFVLRSTRLLPADPPAEEAAEGAVDAGRLAAPPPVPREHKGLLTKYTLHDARDGSDVHVPFWALTRDYERPIKLSASACRGCSQGDCAHGWPPGSRRSAGPRARSRGGRLARVRPAHPAAQPASVGQGTVAKTDASPRAFKT